MKPYQRSSWIRSLVWALSRGIALIVCILTLLGATYSIDPRTMNWMVFLLSALLMVILFFPEHP